MNIAAIGWIVGFASSVDSAALKQATAEFGVGEVTESLATGLFLIGFGVGALFAGPMSETVGRNPVYIATLSLYMIFIMASGLAPNIGAQLAFRFIAGCFAATPLTCAGGSISDLWGPMERVRRICPYFPIVLGFKIDLFAIWKDSADFENREDIRVPCVRQRCLHGSHIWSNCGRFYWRVFPGVVALDRMDHTHHLRPCPFPRHHVSARDLCPDPTKMESS